MLTGVLVCAVVGALANGSNPVILVNSIAALAAITLYIQGAEPATRRDPGGATV